MKRFAVLTVAAVLMAGVPAAAAPEMNLSGYLDADVWSDLKGSIFTNEELDLGLSMKFSEKASVNFYSTVRAGTIPAGVGRPGERWASLAFDGLDITYATGIGTFSVGDLVYQYGKFNYYLYKRKSMITAESFTRGLSYTFGSDMFSQTILAGAADVADEIGIPSDTTIGAVPKNAADIGGKSIVKPAKDQEIGVYYGVRMDARNSFKKDGSAYVGLEYKGVLGEMLNVKFDAGYTNLNGESSTFAFLLEPVLTLGKFSTALTFYTFLDPDTTGTNPIAEEMLVYVEPGYSFSDRFAAGLPLELHTKDTDAFAKSSELWTVPTFYIFPAEGLQWWLWAQIAKPMEDGDPYYGIGSEIVITF